MPSPRKRPSLQVSLVFQTPDLKPSLKRWLAPRLSRIAALAKVNRGSITLVLVDDAEMSRLHAEYKGDPSTTDVLTFDLREMAFRTIAIARRPDCAVCGHLPESKV